MITFNNWKIEARHFDISHMILFCLSASQLIFEDEIFQIWKGCTKVLTH